MDKRFIQVAGVLGALAVILGAFGAHALKEILSEKSLQTFEVGVRYQFYHVFALLLVAILSKDFGGKLLKWSGNLFIIGILLFSGSLYLLTYFQHNEMLSFYKIGAITPLGGLSFITGWILLALAVTKKK
jgi:uncharacterized membrane protein YgdD (TMEM256/DUF423 family)